MLADRAGLSVGAFEEAFGMDPDDFYDAFEEYRETLYATPVPADTDE